MCKCVRARICLWSRVCVYTVPVCKLKNRKKNPPETILNADGGLTRTEKEEEEKKSQITV